MTVLALLLSMIPSFAEIASPLPAILPSSTATADPFLFLPEPVCESPVADPLPRVHVHSEPAFMDSNLLPGVRQEGEKRSQKNSLSVDWAALNGGLAARDPVLARDEPIPKPSTWATDETLKVPVSDTLFVFGSVDAASDSVEQQQLRWAGKTGVGVKVRPWLLDEFQLRTGQALRYDDQDKPPKGFAPERTELFLDVSTKLPVPILGRPINVEYSSTSIPAITGYDRAHFNQDLKFALPLSDGLSKVHLGAKMTRDDVPMQTPWFDRTQLYLGLELKH